MSQSARASVYKIGRVASLVLGLVCCGSTLALAQDTPPASVPGELPPDRPATPAPPISPELERRLEELDQRTRIAERKLELAQEAAAQKPAVPVTSATESGFGITSADKVFDVKLHALLQVDGRYAFSDDPAFRDKVVTFLLRRVRPILDATVLGLVDLRITPDFGNATTAIYDAYADIHPAPWLRFRAGKFKPPIGLERLQTDAWVPFAERTLDSNLSSQRDVGLEIWGDIANAAAHYEIAVLNGNPDGSLVDVDNDRRKSVAGRLFLRPFQLGDLREFGDLGFGFAAEVGDEKGTTAISNGAASNTWLTSGFKADSQQTIFTYISSGTDATATVYASGHHTRINPQLYYYVGPFGLLAEWVRESQQLGKGTLTKAGAVNNSAGHVTASFVLGGLETYDGPRIPKPLNWATRDLGALELAARYGWLDVDDVAFLYTSFADPTKSVSNAKNWGLSANWWFNRDVKLGLTFEQTRFTGGAGTSKAVADRATENIGFGRVQVAF